MAPKKNLFFVMVMLTLVSCTQMQPLALEKDASTPTSLEVEGSKESYFPFSQDLWAAQIQLTGDIAYINDFAIGTNEKSQTIWAFDLAEGKSFWQITRSLRLPMTNDGERLFALTQTGIEAISMIDGERLWQVTTDLADHPVGELLASSDGRLFFAYTREDSTSVSAFNAKTGANIWNIQLDTPLDPFSSIALPKLGYRAVTYDEEVLYLRIRGRGWDSWKFIALDARTGSMLWEYSFEMTLPQEGPVTSVASEPVFDQDAIYFGTLDHHFYALDKRTGTLLWEREQQFEQPVSYAGQLFAISDIYTLSAFDAHTGELKWATPFSEPGELGVLAPLTFYKDYLVLYVYVPISEEHPVRIMALDMKNGEIINTLSPVIPKGCTPNALALSYSSGSLYSVTPNCVIAFQIPTILPGQ